MSANKKDLADAQAATATILASIEASLQAPIVPPAPVTEDLTDVVAGENALTDKARAILLKLQPTPPAPPAA